MEPKRQLECVPNVSEGRRHDLIARLFDESEVPGMRLIGRASDHDHNRTVFTWLGEPDALREAAVRLCESAMNALDLTTQKGVHPRLGVVDVVPFIPIGTTPMEVATSTARATARDIQALCDVPTFLYGAAASRLERRKLADHRRGGPSSLAKRIASGNWRPDFGDHLHPTAGAVLVGSRHPLTAFNVILDSPDRAVASRIAKAIRQVTEGGLPGVQALGFYLPSLGRGQVSVNLLEPTQTRLIDVVERVQRHAEELGTRITGSELVGLAPRRAVAGCSASDLRLPDLSPEQILETHLDS